MDKTWVELTIEDNRVVITTPSNEDANRFADMVAFIFEQAGARIVDEDADSPS